MNIKDIKDIDSLKSIGKFIYVKNVISNETMLPIRARSWNSLLDIIIDLNQSIFKNKNFIEGLLDEESKIKKLGNFKDSKRLLEKKIGHKITAKGWIDLHKKVKNLYYIFIKPEPLTLYEKKKIYESIKYENFVSSSKLENIEISPVYETLDELESKYKMLGANING